MSCYCPFCVSFAYISIKISKKRVRFRIHNSGRKIPSIQKLSEIKSRKKSCLLQSGPEKKILHWGRFGFIALLQSVGYHSPKLLGGGKRPQRKHGETPLCISGLRHLEQVQIRMEHF